MIKSVGFMEIRPMKKNSLVKKNALARYFSIKVHSMPDLKAFGMQS